MKKSYSIMPFPIIVLSYIAITFCLPLFYFGRISLLAVVVVFVATIFILTFKKTYQIDSALSNLKIYRQLLFFKINVKALKPKEIIIFTKVVEKRSIDGKYGGGGSVSHYTRKMIICNEVDERNAYEEGGYIEHLEEIASFLKEHLRVEVKYKSERIKDDEKPAVV